jgi:hypothetical protein
MTDLEALADGTYTAVVDNIEDDLATVFFEEDGTDVASAVLDASALPAAARQADAVLTARVEGGVVVEWTYDPERTTSRADQAQSRFDQLSSRPPSDEDH